MPEIDKTKIEGPVTYLEVFDMPVSIRFYRDIIGFTVAQSSGEGDDVDWVMLHLNGSYLMLNTAYDRDERPEVPDPVRTLGHADVILFFGYPDIDAFYTYLSGEGLDPQAPSVTKYNYKATSCSDPDGYQLCFHWPLG